MHETPVLVGQSLLLVLALLGAGGSSQERQEFCIGRGESRKGIAGKIRHLGPRNKHLCTFCSVDVLTFSASAQKLSQNTPETSIFTRITLKLNTMVRCWR